MEERGVQAAAGLPKRSRFGVVRQVLSMLPLERKEWDKRKKTPTIFQWWETKPKGFKLKSNTKRNLPKHWADISEELGQMLVVLV